MLRIGICGGKLGDVIPDKPKEPWMKKIDKKYYDKKKQGYLYEPSLVAAINHKYKNVEATYYPNKLNEKELQKNDINFLAGINLLNAWEKSDAEYNKWFKIMEDPKNNIYPSLKEQFFLYNKGDYLKYYEKKGIPIAPTFIVREDRNAKDIITKVKKQGWASFVLKPHYAYANASIKRVDLNDKGAEKDLTKYLNSNKHYPAFVCQQVMDGFAKFWEVKSFWLNGKFKYYIAMKACDQVFSESKIYATCQTDYGDVSPKILKLVKKMGKKVMDNYPKTYVNGKVSKPLFLRIDFGCCLGNTMDGSSYFLNEVEYAGCGVFTEQNNIFHLWPTAYYTKAKEIYDSKKKKKNNKRTKRVTKKEVRHKRQMISSKVGKQEFIFNSA